MDFISNTVPCAWKQISWNMLYSVRIQPYFWDRCTTVSKERGSFCDRFIGECRFRWNEQQKSWIPKWAEFGAVWKPQRFKNIMLILKNEGKKILHLKCADGIHCGFFVHIEQIIDINSRFCVGQHVKHKTKWSTANTEINAKNWQTSRCRKYLVNIWRIAIKLNVTKELMANKSTPNNRKQCRQC